MNSARMLAEGGLVADHLPGYELRPQQLEMAEAVADAFEAGEHLLIEAGTGVGKSFAYLVPSIQRVLDCGGRVVISTHTIALQEQLFRKDIPFLREVFAKEFSAVLVKGRSNYLGLRRLARASNRHKSLFDATGQVAELHAIEDWAYKTQDGSLSDLPTPPSLPVWDRVRSESDDCMGRRCPSYEPCFYQRARRRAAKAQLLIVNHALLFSDIAIRARGAAILPDYDYVILDEAHTVENVAGEHLGTNITSAQLYYLLNVLHNERTGRGVLATNADGPARDAVVGARQAVTEYVDSLQLLHMQRPAWNGRLTEPPETTQPVSAALIELQQALRERREAISDDGDRSELAAMAERCKEFAGALEDWHDQKAEASVYWIEVDPARPRRITLGSRPIDVGPILKERLFDRVNSVVMTSATLTTAGDEPFGYVRKRLGLPTGREIALGSPFNYREQVTVHLPAGMPDPRDTEAYIPAACQKIQEYVALTKGGAFVLFTSHAMMRQCADLLTPYFESQDLPLFVQDSQMPRSMMLERFREIPESVLFGTDTFWAGVDVPGDALSNVIIVKLPFAAPSHPITEARIERIREQGGNPFMEYQIPEAVLKFRQGVGRLIRSRTDRGIVVILDPRVRTKSYGRVFLEALPDCRIVREQPSKTHRAPKGVQPQQPPGR